MAGGRMGWEGRRERMGGAKGKDGRGEGRGGCPESIGSGWMMGQRGIEQQLLHNPPVKHWYFAVTHPSKPIRRLIRTIIYEVNALELNHIKEPDKEKVLAEAELSAEKLLSESTSKCRSNLNIAVIDTGIDNKSVEKELDMTGDGTHVAGVGDISKPSCTIESKSLGGSQLFDSAAEMITGTLADREFTRAIIVGEQTYGKGIPSQDLFSIGVTPLVDLFSDKFDSLEK
jgi:hypothetical protein